MKLAIDIGPTLARAAYLDASGAPQLVGWPDGSSALPALARQTMHGLLVGTPAAQTLVGNAETTVVGCTRLLGGQGTWPPELTERLPYSVRDIDGTAYCNLLYAEVSAPSIYGQLVHALVAAAEHSSGQAVDGVVLCVPAGAEHRFRVAAKAAVEQLGRPVQRIINQPSAALLAASVPADASIIAVVNCGAGSTEVTIAERLTSGTRILATASDMVLGSDDLAWTVARRLSERFQHTSGIDVWSADRAGVARAGLQRAAAGALETLVHAPETLLVLDHGGGFGRDLATVVRRSDVDTWLQPQLEQIGALCRRALQSSQRQPSAIDAVVLIGEAAHLPQLRQTIAANFARPVGQLQTHGAATLAVRGAALASAQAAPLVWDVTPYPLGINCYYGAEELFSPIISANTPIPTPAVHTAEAYTQSYQTRFPDQTSVQLDMLQYRGPRTPQTYGANRVYPNECELLGSWAFSGLKPKRGQCAGFTVTFSIDGDGIVHLSAVETATGHRLDVQTRGSL